MRRARHVPVGLAPHRLGAARRLWIADGRLTLGDLLGAERLAFVPRPVRSVDAAAVATGRWRFDPAASTVTPPEGGAAPGYHAAFAPDSISVGAAGCLAFSGTYSLAGVRLDLASLTVEAAGCDADERTWSGAVGLRSGELKADDEQMPLISHTDDQAGFARG